VAGF